MTTVSYDSRALTIDGQRTLLLSGAIHYPRSTPAMWPELMRRTKAAGLNAVETYVFWNLHERQRGVFDFSDRLDLIQFCRVAQEHGLFVVLRIGPYICAEINFGGFPAWLREVPGLQTRTWNQPFMQEMERWVRYLCDYLEPMFVANGGPIIIGQIENEYALIARTYGEDGQRYLAWAIALGQSLELGVAWVMCVGGMPGAIETINGFYGHTFIAKHQASHPDQPLLWTEDWTGWYDTWGYPHHRRSPEDEIYAVARFIAEGGTGVNYYMWHGGTNFGRDAMFLQTTSYDYDAPLDEFGLPTTKSNHAASLHRALHANAAALLANPKAAPQPLGPQQAAFVYGDLAFLCNDDAAAAAPVSFAGESYVLAPHSVLIVYAGTVLFDTSAVAGGDAIQRTMRPIPAALDGFMSWQEPLPSRRHDVRAGTIAIARPIEQLQFTKDESDYCWYSARVTIGLDEAGAGTLTLSGAGDLVHLFVDGTYVASAPSQLLENRSRPDGDLDALRRSLADTYFDDAPTDIRDVFRLEFAIALAAGQHEIELLCCGLGLIKGDWQIGFMNMVDERKGIWGAVAWGGREIGPWTLHPFLAGELAAISSGGSGVVGWSAPTEARRPLCWYRTTFDIPEGDAPLALDMGSMGKGLVWVNGRCIGRHWLIAADVPEFFGWLQPAVTGSPAAEPTQRYYHVPRAWLEEHNTLVIFEEIGGDPEAIQLCVRE